LKSITRCQLFSLAAVVVLGPLLTLGDVYGQASDRGEEPSAGPEPVLYYRADPTRFGSSTAWLPVFLRFAGAAGVVPERQQGVFDSLMFVGLMGSYPHRFAVLDLDAHRYIPRDVRVNRFRSVLVFDAPGKYAQIKQALVSILMPKDGVADAKQTAIDLPAAPGSDRARPGVRFTRDKWRDEQAIEWTADGRSFYIGFGHGSLQHWLAWQDGHTTPDATTHPHPPITRPHRGAIARARGVEADTPDVFFELFLDLDGLRRSAPTLFRTGRITPLLRMYGIEDARQWMMHGRWADRFLLFDLTWQPGARVAPQANEQAAEPTITYYPLSQDHWPTDAGVPEPPGHFLVAAPIDWPAAVQRLMQLIWLAHAPEARHLVTDSLDAFFDTTGVTFSESLSRFEPYLLLGGHPRSWIPLPGTATLYAPLRPDADAPTAAAEFQTMMQALLPGSEAPVEIARPADANALRVRQDPATRVYWLDSPLRAIFKAPAWVWHEPDTKNIARRDHRPMLIGSYSPQAVLTNTKWLNGEQ